MICERRLNYAISVCQFIQGLELGLPEWWIWIAWQHVKCRAFKALHMLFLVMAPEFLSTKVVLHSNHSSSLLSIMNTYIGH